MAVIERFRFESRGAFGCSNSDYHLQRLTCCGTFVVEDYELSDLYFDPGDLSKRISLLRNSDDTAPLVCPVCDAEEWDLVEVEGLSDVPEPWRWACRPQ